MPTGYPQTVTLAPTPAFDGIAKIRKGDRGENIWSVQANLSGLDVNVGSYVDLIALDPDNYTINKTDIGVFFRRSEISLAVCPDDEQQFSDFSSNPT